MLDAVMLAGLETDMMGKVMALATDPKDALAAVTSLGRAFMARDSRVLPECTRCGETCPSFNT
jgi:hypothetical protein